MEYLDDDDIDVIKTQKRIDTQYFIDTKGRVHKWKGSLKDARKCSSLHFRIAEELFPDVSEDVSPDDYVIGQGWILVGSSVYSHPIIHKTPTQAQLDTLFDLRLLDSLTILDGKYYVKYTL